MVLFFTILFTKLPLQPKPIYRFGRSTLQNKASEIVDIWKLLCEGVPWWVELDMPKIVAGRNFCLTLRQH
jgi:hypothetical protein